MNVVYIDSALAASPIYIGPNNASSVTIGNTNCTTIIGQSLNLANPNFGNPIGGNTSGGQLLVNGDTNGPYASDTGQFIITGNSAPKYRLGFMVDTSFNRTSIQAGVSGTAIIPISLNPGGGNIGIGKYDPTQALDVNGNIALSGNIVLSGTIPTLNTHLGQRLVLVNNTGYTTSSTAGAITSPVSFTLPLGVWLVTTSCQVLASVVYFTTSISLNSTTLDYTRWCVVSNSDGGNVTNSIITTINSTSATTPYYYLIQSSGVSSTTSVTYIYATRIG